MTNPPLSDPEAFFEWWVDHVLFGPWEALMRCPSAMVRLVLAGPALAASFLLVLPTLLLAVVLTAMIAAWNGHR